mmetsp:Transcript_62888/g.149889  ORF Transcript_62888/g.149889 Transcript_62888/m.149889 type:complete len:398 (-) Transcript_62888:1920-3113(-)
MRLQDLLEVRLSGRDVALRVGSVQLLERGLLREAPPQPRVEEGPRVPPVHDPVDAALLGHAHRHVMQVRVVLRDPLVEGEEQRLTRLQLVGERPPVLIGGGGHLDVDGGDFGVEARHRLQQLVVPVLDLHDPGRLEDAAAGSGVRVHLHLLRVDRRVDHHPRPAAKFPVRGDVHEDWLLVVHERLDDHRSEFEDRLVHVALPPREAAPVRHDHQREPLHVEIPDCGCRLVRRVREPHLPRLRHLLLLRVRVRWVRRMRERRRALLWDDDAHRDASEARAPADCCHAPAREGLAEGALVEEPPAPLANRVLRAREQEAGVVDLLGVGPAPRVEDLAVDRVQELLRVARYPQDGEDAALDSRDERDPREDGGHALQVVRHHLVGDAVVVHDLRPAELVV